MNPSDGKAAKKRKNYSRLTLRRAKVFGDKVILFVKRQVSKLVPFPDGVEEICTAESESQSSRSEENSTV